MQPTARFRDALNLAALLHAHQFRKQSPGSAAPPVPYIAHLLAVTALAIEHGADEDEAIAALLHDAVEDQGGDGTRQRIRLLFGERVAEIVEGCTDADVLPKPPWEERKRHHLAAMAEAGESVLLVALADKLHNVRSILADYLRDGEDTWARFTGGRDGTLWYYRAMTDTLAHRSPPRLSTLVQELDRAVAELERAAASG
ncbi:MAG: HD domain-containing protein [Actinomycetota bacterium]